MIKALAKKAFKIQASWDSDPLKVQEKVFHKLIKGLVKTEYGKKHKLFIGMTIEDYQKATSLMEYEDYEKEYLPKIKTGEKNILWPGKTKYICQSSGTTSGLKYIPTHHIAIIHFIKASFFSSLVFMQKTKNFDLFSKQIFHLFGLSTTEIKNGMVYGYIGQLANSFVPKFLVRSKYPKNSHQQFENWQEKVEFLAKDLIQQDLSVMGGTPPWMNDVLTSFNKTHQSKFADHFSHLKLYIHGGCDFSHYRKAFFELLGTKNIYTMESYPASEGYIGFQVDWDENNPSGPMPMTLNLEGNIFFEFLPFENSQIDKSQRLTVSDLEIGKTYTLVVSTMGSYLSYIIGDNINVESLNPLRITFAGRSKQNVNLVNEHMDFRTIQKIFEKLNYKFSHKFLDYVLIPKVENTKAHYKWYLCTKEKISTEMSGEVSRVLSSLSHEANSFYERWAEANFISESVEFIKEDALLAFLQRKKSVGQNKVPHVILNQVSQTEFQAFIEDFKLI